MPAPAPCTRIESACSSGFQVLGQYSQALCDGKRLNLRRLLLTTCWIALRQQTTPARFHGALINSTGPSSAVDRVHTALHGYMIAACDASGIAYNPDPGITELVKLLRKHHPGLQSGLLFKTTDGGASWAAVQCPENCFRGANISCGNQTISVNIPDEFFGVYASFPTASRSATEPRMRSQTISRVYVRLRFYLIGHDRGARVSHRPFCGGPTIEEESA